MKAGLIWVIVTKLCHTYVLIMNTLIVLSSFVLFLAALLAIAMVFATRQIAIARRQQLLDEIAMGRALEKRADILRRREAVRERRRLERRMARHAAVGSRSVRAAEAHKLQA